MTVAQKKNDFSPCGASRHASDILRKLRQTPLSVYRPDRKSDVRPV